MNIPFNIPFVSGSEAAEVTKAIQSRRLCGGGKFGELCESKLSTLFTGSRTLMTTSCTDALEMCAALIDIGPGDEVIAPSFTFVSSVNPFVIRGGVVKFVDVSYPSLNATPEAIEAAITSKTKAVIAVHYGGGSTDIGRLRALCDKHDILLIEDAAQSLLATSHGKQIGTEGHLACLSFHETKNIHCGEGGALIVNDKDFFERAEIIREKGTDRSRFFRGQVDKYSWVDIGSSHIPSELNSAFLSAQLDEAVSITTRRRDIWNKYQAYCVARGIDFVRFDDSVEHNAHVFGIFAKDLEHRTQTIQNMRAAGVQCVFHYVPLHSSAMGRKFGHFVGEDVYTTKASENLIRLPLYPELDDEKIGQVLDSLTASF